MAFTYVTITHTYQLAGNVPASGKIEFKPIVPMHNGLTVVSAKVTATLSGIGALSVVLAANTDPATTPTGTVYEVTEKIDGQSALTYYVQVPHNQGSTLDLRVLAGWVGGSGATGTVSSVNNIAPNGAGNITLSAPDVGAQLSSALLTRLAAEPVTLTAVSGVITPDAATSCRFWYIATTDIQMGAFTGGSIDGQPIAVAVQASLGARTVSFPVGGPDPVTIVSGEWWVFRFLYRSAGDVWVPDSGSGGSGGSSGGYSIVQDEGSSLASRPTLNFIGSSVSVADDLANARTNVTISGGGSGGYATVQDEGSGLTARATLNFVGSGVTVTDDAANTRTLVTIPGGGTGGYATVQDEAISLTSRATLNFVGRPVTAVDNAGSVRTDVTVLDTVPVHAVGNSGTALTVDAGANAGPVKTITMTGNCTLTFSAVTSGRLVTMDLLLTQDATGGRTATWPSSVKWSGGAPVLSTTASARDWLTFSTPDGGTTWYGAVVGKGFA